MNNSKRQQIFDKYLNMIGDGDDETWKTTITYIPIIEQYKTIKGSTSWVDGKVMEMIKDGWQVHGLPQSFTVSNNIVAIQTMVKYASDK